MKKLILNVDALRVESFNTSTGMQRHGGTVEAREHSHAGDCLTPGHAQYSDSCQYTFHGCTFDPTRCEPSCAGDTCPGSTEMGAVTCGDGSC